MSISNPSPADQDCKTSSLPPHSQCLAQSIAQTFEYSAKVHASRTAVVGNDTEWNYEELNHRANQIAHKIINVQHDTTMSTCVLCDHSPAAIAAILGILKSGNAYVPIEPTYPTNRMQSILADFPDALLVVDENHAAIAAKLVANQSRIITVSGASLSHGLRNPTVTVEPDDFAYILYTSGSTGRPKGVVQDQKSIMFEIQRATTDLELTRNDRIALLFSTSFSASVSPLFGALLNGAAVYMYDIKHKGLDDFGDWLRHNRISICDLNPTLFRAFDNSLTGDEDLPDLRIVALTGEPVQASDVILYKKFFPHARLQNGFGSTETKTIAQLFIDSDTQFTTEVVPAGYPIPGKDLELLDDQGQSVKTGEVGEIVVKSKYISPGYWSRNALVRNEILRAEDNSDVRIYRSGDRGYFDDHGRLVCVGRNDAQIKINGVRIEPGEIEAILGRHPAIQQAVVLCRKDGSSNKQLVAYILVSTTPAPDTLELHNYLTAQLPAYMIPAAFVFLPNFPLLPNGKVDRRALPMPDLIDRAKDDTSTNPRTPLEKLVAEIWQNVLSAKSVRRHDNFFKLGGHSLPATQVIARIKKRLEIDVPLRTLFEQPTVAGFAESTRQIWRATLAGILEADFADSLNSVGVWSEEEIQALLEEKIRDTQNPREFDKQNHARYS